MMSNIRLSTGNSPARMNNSDLSVDGTISHLLTDGILNKTEFIVMSQASILYECLNSV